METGAAAQMKTTIIVQQFVAATCWEMQRERKRKRQSESGSGSGEWESRQGVLLCPALPQMRCKDPYKQPSFSLLPFVPAMSGPSCGGVIAIRKRIMKAIYLHLPWLWANCNFQDAATAPAKMLQLAATRVVVFVASSDVVKSQLKHSNELPCLASPRT